VHRPDLLILDEPTVGLDPEHRDRMWALLDTERRACGATILFAFAFGFGALGEASRSSREKSGCASEGW